jgi:hypothetical protein
MYYAYLTFPEGADARPAGSPTVQEPEVEAAPKSPRP